MKITVVDVPHFVERALKGEPVAKLAREAGMFPAQLSRLVIAHPGYAEAVANGHIRRRMTYSAEQLRELPHVKAVRAGQGAIDAAKEAGISPDTVRTHYRKAYPDEPSPPKSDQVEISNVHPGPDLTGLLPLISWVEAGYWGEANDPFQPGEAEDWLPSPRKCSANSYVLRVRGDSMTAPAGARRTYPEGTLIFVDPEKKSPVNGDRIIAKLKGAPEVTFKVYKNEDGRQWLMPLNPLHEPIRDEFKVLGTVIGAWMD